MGDAAYFGGRLPRRKKKKVKRKEQADMSIFVEMLMFKVAFIPSY